MSRCTYVRTSRHEPIQGVCLQERHTIVTLFFSVILYDAASRVSMYIVVGHEYMLESRQLGNLKT
jgi:hypothetical protein